MDPWLHISPELASEISNLLRPLRDWEPMLMPARDDLHERIETVMTGVNHQGVTVCTPLELAMRTLQEGKQNRELRKRTQKFLRDYVDRDEPSQNPSRTAEFLAENTIYQAPMTICRPLSVTTIDNLLRSHISFSCSDDQLRDLRASLSGSFWWKYRTKVPGAIRDLVWYTLMTGCIGIMTSNHTIKDRMRTLLSLLIDGNWPIARDPDQQLIVLVTD